MTCSNFRLSRSDHALEPADEGIVPDDANHLQDDRCDHDDGVEIVAGIDDDAAEPKICVSDHTRTTVVPTVGRKDE